MRPKIEGKTAAAVIRIVVADLDAEIARTEGQLGSADADKTLSKIVIENERYYWEQTGLYRARDGPILDLQRQRQGHLACFSQRRVGVARPRHALGDRRVSFYGFTPALQPGMQQQAKIFITRGEFADSELERVYDAGLTLKVTNADDTAGRRLLIVNSDLIESMRMERLALRGS